MPVTRDDVIAVYRAILNRDPESEQAIRHHAAHSDSVLALAGLAAHSVEFTQQILGRHSAGHPVGVFGGRHYEVIRTGGTYAPWRSDPLFLATYQAVRDHTLVDLYRCWNLWQLVAQAAKRSGPAAHFIEIGVWRGGTGVLMARRMAQLGLTQPIHLCDTFAGVVKAGVEDPHYSGGEHADTSTAVVTALASSVGVGNCRLCVGIFPEDAPPSLNEGPVAFCHIDVDTHDSAAGCFNAVWPRLVPGGVVVFDDYGGSTTSGVARLVDGLAELPDCVWQYNLNSHAVATKVAG